MGVSSNKKKLDADLEHIEVQAEEAERQRALDAETIRLNLSGQDGEKIVIKARLSGSLKEFKEKTAVEVGLTKECGQHLETHLSGYELKPDTKIIRDFTELCEDSEIDLQGMEKAKTAMAMKVDVFSCRMSELELVAGYAPERLTMADSSGKTPLHEAAYHSQEAAIRFLLSAGANVNATMNNGRTPLSCTTGLPRNDRGRQLLIAAGGTVTEGY